MSLVVSCGYGVRGSLLNAVRPLYDPGRSLACIASSKWDLLPGYVWSGRLFITSFVHNFKYRTFRHTQEAEGVRCRNNRISSLLFADDVVMLASSSQDLRHVLGRLAAECEAAGMTIRTSQVESKVLDWKRVVCPHQVGEVLPKDGAWDW